MWKPVIITIGIATLIGAIAYYYDIHSSDPEGRVSLGDILTDNTMPHTLILKSSAFSHEGRIPPKYTCDGENMSPPLSWEGAPPDTKSFVLIVEDPDVPKELVPEGVFYHWVLFNISKETKGIDEGASAGTGGNNSSNTWSYYGPCPPTQFEPSTHRYIFTLYALDSTLDFSRGASKQMIEDAMKEHILDKTELIGSYSRKR